MAFINGVYVHDCDQLVASAERGLPDIGHTYLQIRLGSEVYAPYFDIHMDYDRAARIAAAINAADQPQAIQIEHMPAAAE